MGFLDLPAPALSWADAKLAASLPATACLLVWGSIGAVVSMGLYWLASPQQGIAKIVAEERRIKETLWSEATEISAGLASVWGLLRLALTRLGMVVLPTLVAAVPLLSLMTWLSTSYAYDLPPPGRTAAVRVEPTAVQGRWIAAKSGLPRVDLVDHQGSVLHSLTVSVPVPIIHKRAWWNALIGNPLGYLPDDGPVERVDIGLPERQYLMIGPRWSRSWAVPFIASLLVGSLVLKFFFRIR